MCLATPRKSPPEEFLAMPDDQGCELVEGEPVPMNGGDFESRTDNRLLGIIADDSKINALGAVRGSETLVRCCPDRANLGNPTGFLVGNAQFSTERTNAAVVEIVPDLVVQIVFPKNSSFALPRRVREFLSAGVRIVWVISPEYRTVSIHRIDRTLAERTLGDDLEGEDVLPGLGCPVDSLFPATSTPPAPPG